MSAIAPVFPEVLGAKEVAALLGVHVSNLNAIPDLPLAVSKVSATRLWLAEDIEAFAAEYRQRRTLRLSKQ
jgi:hypothetical protein